MLLFSFVKALSNLYLIIVLFTHQDLGMVIEWRVKVFNNFPKMNTASSYRFDI